MGKIGPLPDSINVDARFGMEEHFHLFQPVQRRIGVEPIREEGNTLYM
jgi:hypothetical protein